MTTTTLDVQGMTCQSCIRDVREALSVEGVARVDVRVDDGRVEVEHDARVSEAALIAAVRAAGYDVGPAAASQPRRGCCCGHGAA